MSKRTAENLAELLKTDSELLDLIYPPRLMGIEEAAKYACIPVGTLYKRTAEIPHMKVGRRIIFSDRGLIRWMKRQ
jgi:hypothetical protein